MSNCSLRICLLAVLCWLVTPDGAMAQPVSVQVTDGNVRDVLTALAKTSQVNLIIDDSVQGKLNICMSNVEFDTAISLIARVKELHYEKQNGVYIIRSGKSDAAGIGMLPHQLPVHYLTGEQVIKSAAMVLGLSPDAAKQRLVFQDNGHKLLYYGSEQSAGKLAEELKTLDIPQKQVSIEAKVISLDKNEAKKLGLEWEWSKLPQSPDVDYTNETTTESVWNEAKSRYETITTTVPHKRVERTWKNGEGLPGIIHFGETENGQPLEMYYAAKLDALFTNGKAKVLAKPNIMAEDGQEAVINIGGSVPVPTVSTTNTATTTSLSYHDVGVILRYKPFVHDDGTISAVVHIEVSSPLYVEEMKAYRFNKRAVDTSVRLKNGETMVIGGLIGSEEMANMSRIPLLGDLPVIGQLFRHQEKSSNKSEVMIFLTAKTVK